MPTKDTYRTTCGRGRASYHPEWSASQPWALYVDGTATRHAATLEQAAAYFKSKRMTLKGD